MTTEGFVASHARDAKFERGLRFFYEYRDLGLPAGFTTVEVPSVNG